MNPCETIECSNWTDIGTLCVKCCSAIIAEPKKATRAYDALPEQVHGIGVVTTRRIMVNRIKSVRRNGPVSYYSMYSEDMLRDERTLDTRKPAQKLLSDIADTVVEALEQCEASRIKLDHDWTQG